jgi:hypothetical protein
VSSGLESVWTGSGSEAVQAKIKPLGEVANAASQTFTANAQNLTGLAHGFEAMKQSLKPMPPTRACHSNCVSQRCTKIDSPSWRSEGTPSDTEHIVSSG